ncbi:MAG: C69 family dipeptidase [Methanoregula sp.]|jgi:dipeptidase
MCRLPTTRPVQCVQSGTIRTPAPVTLAYITEVNHTYGYYTGAYAIMNEHQLMFGECTDLTKAEPSFDRDKRIFYSTELSNIAAERTITAWEAVLLIGSLIDQYGYYGTSETLPIADPDEAWVIEMAGGTTDGTVFVAANTFRIRDVGPDDPDMLYSKNLFATARANGWWNPSQGKLDWLRAVSNGEYAHPYYSLARVWSVYDWIAPLRNFSPFISDTYSRNYPFSIKPDHLLTIPDVLSLFRNHYEGTVFDLTTGEAAGPFKNQYRWRGTFDDHARISPGEVKPGAWPRAVSEMFTGYSYIVQGRSSMPDTVGGVIWFGFAQPSETVYMPFYAGGTSVQPFGIQPRFSLVGV